MTTNEFLKKLYKLRACKDSLDWVATQPDAQTAWDSCTREDWLEWYFEKTATTEMRKEYFKAWLTASEKLNKAERDAVQKYVRVQSPQQPDWGECEKAERAARDEYNNTRVATIRKLMPSP